MKRAAPFLSLSLGLMLFGCSSGDSAAEDSAAEDIALGALGDSTGCDHFSGVGCEELISTFTPLQQKAHHDARECFEKGSDPIICRCRVRDITLAIIPRCVDLFYVYNIVANEGPFHCGICSEKGADCAKVCENAVSGGETYISSQCGALCTQHLCNFSDGSGFHLNPIDFALAKRSESLTTEELTARIHAPGSGGSLDPLYQPEIQMCNIQKTPPPPLPKCDFTATTGIQFDYNVRFLFEPPSSGVKTCSFILTPDSTTYSNGNFSFLEVESGVYITLKMYGGNCSFDISSTNCARPDLLTPTNYCGANQGQILKCNGKCYRSIGATTRESTFLLTEFPCP